MDAEPERWLGLLVAAGTLAVLALWWVLDRASTRVRNVLAFASAALLISATGAALVRSGIFGYALGSDFLEEPDGGRQVADVVLGLVGLAAGLLVTVGMWPAPEPLAEPAAGTAEEPRAPAEAPVDDEPLVGDEPAAPETADAADAAGAGVADVQSAYWSSHTADEPPRTLPRLRVPAPTATLLAIAVGLGLPIYQFSDMLGFFGLAQLYDADGYAAAAMVVDGLITGLALLLAALAVRGRDVGLVVGAFAFAAAGRAVATAWPDTFTNEFWFMFGSGLAIGLLVPVVLRLLSPALTADGAAVGWGLLLAVALLAGESALRAQAAEDGLGFVANPGIDVDVDNEIDVPDFPTDFPSFVFPTNFPTDFPTDFPGFPTDFPTFTFPSGFPTP